MVPAIRVEGCMGDVCEEAPRPPGACQDARALAQRALACELCGELELAVALIRCLQQPGPDCHGDLRRSQRCERRIA
jgi:hypothetical protein